MHIGEVALDRRKIDRRLDDDAREVSEVSWLIRVEIHQHEVLETRDRRLDTEHSGLLRLGDDGALGFRGGDKEIDGALAVAHDVERLGLSVFVDLHVACEASLIERAKRLEDVLTGNDDVEISGEARKTPNAEGCRSNHGERNVASIQRA